MDVLDPLGTVDAIAPHTTSFSSNIYLLKKESKSFTKGQLLNLSTQLSPSDTEKLLFVVGSQIDPKNFLHPFTSSSLCRIYGYTITFSNGKTQLVESDGEIALGRVYTVDENIEIDAEKISDWNGFEVWAKVAEVGGRDEEEGVWSIMEEQFGKSPELAYYWFIHTGKYYGEVRYSEAEEEEIRALESLDIASLVKTDPEEMIKKLISSGVIQ